jgi:hypothetical protein
MHHIISVVDQPSIPHPSTTHTLTMSPALGLKTNKPSVPGLSSKYLTSQVFADEALQVLQVVPDAVAVGAQLHLVAQRHVRQRVVIVKVPVLEARLASGRVAVEEIVEARKEGLHPRPDTGPAVLLEGGYTTPFQR